MLDTGRAEHRIGEGSRRAALRENDLTGDPVALDGATAEAVAAVGHERATVRDTRGVHVTGWACAHRTWAARVAAGGRHPTLIIARPLVRIEEAVEALGRARGPHAETRLVVVARSRAGVVEPIGPPIAVIVDAIHARAHVALAGDEDPRRIDGPIQEFDVEP